MTDLISLLRVVHIISAILMAWPYYALVAVNQRVKLGPPLGDRADTYIENLEPHHSLLCFSGDGGDLRLGADLSQRPED
jgi:hypothetical protein